MEHSFSHSYNEVEVKSHFYLYLKAVKVNGIKAIYLFHLHLIFYKLPSIIEKIHYAFLHLIHIFFNELSIPFHSIKKKKKKNLFSFSWCGRKVDSITFFFFFFLCVFFVEGKSIHYQIKDIFMKDIFTKSTKLFIH